MKQIYFRDLLQRLNATVIVTDLNLNKNNYNNIKILNINLFKLNKNIQNNELNIELNTTKASDLAYCCFTSGTTGIPKGVCVENRNVIEFIITATKQLNITPKSYLAHSVNCAFDVSVFNIFGCLLNGACLIQQKNLIDFVQTTNGSIKTVLKKEAEIKKTDLSEAQLTKIEFNETTDFKNKAKYTKTKLNSINLKKTMLTEFNDKINLDKKQQKKCCLTHLFLNSAIFNALTNAELDYLCQINLEKLIVGGETPHTESLRYCLLNGINVTQIYGPTETTVWSMYHHLKINEFHGSIIGVV